LLQKHVVGIDLSSGRSAGSGRSVGCSGDSFHCGVYNIGNERVKVVEAGVEVVGTLAVVVVACLVQGLLFLSDFRFCLASAPFSLSGCISCSAFRVCVGFALVFWGEAVVVSVFSLVLVLPFLLL
jgi:hypothetical protein